jgi:predicted ester cyclase
VKFVKLAPAVLALTMLSQSLVAAQDVAQSPWAATSQPEPPQTATESSGQVSGAVPTQNAASPMAEIPPAENQPVDTLPRKYVELWNTGEMGPAMSMFSSPYFINSGGGPRLRLSVGMLAGVVHAWRDSMPDLNLKIEDTIIQGDKVAMRLSLTGTYRSRLFPDTAEPNASAPSTIKATEMLFFQLQDGKISEIWQEYDELAMRYRMGGAWRTNAELAAPANKVVPGSGSSPSPKR